MNLERFPRVDLCHLPTPLEPLDRLSEHLEGPRIFVKRDDCTGLAFGGNKARKLEFLLADALAGGATTVVTVGGVQSNHCRQTAAAAARLGLQCELVLPHLSQYDGPDYETGGNLLLDRLLGAKVHLLPHGAAVAPRVEEVLQRLRQQGERPYFIPAGGSTPLGALGYVDAAAELTAQAAQRQLRFDHVIVTTGSTTTHAGLVVGLAGIAARDKAAPLPVSGVSVYHRRQAAFDTVLARARDTASLLEWELPELANQIQVTDEYLGGGYGEPTAGMLEAVSLAARLEGLLVDPVYTGKTLAGLIDMVRQQKFRDGQNVLFWHTGGGPALFAYREAFTSLEP